MKRTT